MQNHIQRQYLKFKSVALMEVLKTFYAFPGNFMCVDKNARCRTLTFLLFYSVYIPVSR